jgi:hypothetical protein
MWCVATFPRSTSLRVTCHIGIQRRRQWAASSHPKTLELFRSRARSPARAFSTWARLESAQSLRVCRDMPSISMNYVLARSSSQETSGGFARRMNLFADHQLRFATGASAATHQLHHPQRNDTICLECQQHQRIDHFPVLLHSQDERAGMVPKFNQCARCVRRDDSEFVTRMRSSRARCRPPLHEN